MRLRFVAAVLFLLTFGLAGALPVLTLGADPWIALPAAAAIALGVVGATWLAWLSDRERLTKAGFRW